MHAARTLALVVVFFVAAAGDVVGEHPADLAVLVVAGEERNDREALHRGGQVAAHHHAELVGLAFEAQHLALHFLVVLELGLEQLHHLDRGPGRAGDRDTGEVVGGEHLLDAPAGDRVARRRAAVTRHHHAVGVADRDHGRAVGNVDRRRPTRCTGSPAAGAGSLAAGARRTTAPDRYSRRTAVKSWFQTSSETLQPDLSQLSATNRSRATSASSSSRPRYVGRRRARDLRRPASLPDCDVAVPAENAAHAAGLVVVIDVVGVGLPADRAPAALRSEQLVERFERQPVLPLQVTLAIRDLLLAGVRLYSRCHSIA